MNMSKDLMVWQHFVVFFDRYLLSKVPRSLHLTHLHVHHDAREAFKHYEHRALANSIPIAIGLLYGSSCVSSILADELESSPIESRSTRRVKE
jgi:hypothetical protein